MLYKCVNPDCSTPFLDLVRGKLFVLDMTPLVHLARPQAICKEHRSLRHLERYWLCDECACVFTLAYEKGNGICMIALPKPVARAETPTQKFPYRQPGPRIPVFTQKRF